MKKLVILLLLVWVCKEFRYAEDVNKFLNTLSIERATEAKIVIGDHYSWNSVYIFYRVESETVNVPIEENSKGRK